jgi:hypothetical protein
MGGGLRATSLGIPYNGDARVLNFKIKSIAKFRSIFMKMVLSSLIVITIFSLFIGCEKKTENLPKVFYGTYYGDNPDDGRFTISSDNTFNWHYSTGFSKGTFEIIESEGDNPSNWSYGIKIKVIEGETTPDGWEFYMNYANSDMRRVLKSPQAYWHMN